jgi:hypothetical protein
MEMRTKLVLLWDSTTKPWSIDVEWVLDRLARAERKGLTVELRDTKDMQEEELQHWREIAQRVAMRDKLGMRQAFGSKQAGGFPYLGKQVPALIVYEEGSSELTAIYPHTKKRRRKKIDYSIETFLIGLTDSLGG